MAMTWRFTRWAVLLMVPSVFACGCEKKCTKSDQGVKFTQKIFHIRDYQYLERVYYNVGKFGPDSLGWKFEPGRDTIVEFRLFIQGWLSEGNQFACLLVDPNDSTFFARERLVAPMKELSSGEDWFLDNNLFWVRLEHSIGHNELLACWMLVATSSGRIEIGSLWGDTLRLKLLKPRNFNETSATWDYEWKNVYSLGEVDLGNGTFEVDIFRGPPGSEHDPANNNHQNGIPYLQLFGLDLLNQSGVPMPDGHIDHRDAILDMVRGRLYFPSRTPFAPGNVVYAPNAPVGFRLDPQVDAIYRTSSWQTLSDSSQYYIRIIITRPVDST